MKQTNPDTESFTSEVLLAGINPYVNVPEGVVKKLGGGTKARVLVRVSGPDSTKKQAPIQQKSQKLEKDATQLKAIGRLTDDGWLRTTLVPLQSEPSRLYLDTWIRETAEVGVSDRVHVAIKLDLDDRKIPIPTELLEALTENAETKIAWDALPASRQRQILTYLNFLKTPAALERNIRKTVDRLLD